VTFGVSLCLLPGEIARDNESLPPVAKSHAVIDDALF